jgi:hypothetical protein
MKGNEINCHRRKSLRRATRLEGLVQRDIGLVAVVISVLFLSLRRARQRGALTVSFGFGFGLSVNNASLVGGFRLSG